MFMLICEVNCILLFGYGYALMKYYIALTTQDFWLEISAVEKWNFISAWNSLIAECSKIQNVILHLLFKTCVYAIHSHFEGITEPDDGNNFTVNS
jgi:hypothetical protein